MTSEEIQQGFQEELIADGKISKTIISYTGDIRGFVEWLGDRQVDFAGNLSRFYITSYKNHLIETNYSINTINKKINSLNSFNDYLIVRKLTREKVVYPNKDKIKVAQGSEREIERYGARHLTYSLQQMQ